jgi:small subunit ribosomal protein S7e
MSKKPDTTYYLKKVFKSNDEGLTALEEQIARAFVELEMTSKDLSGDMRELFFTSAKEVTITATNKEAYVIFVPYRQHAKFKKIQSRLIRELEKKFSGKHVFFLAQRTILSKSYQRIKPGQLRPRSRTLTAVHNAILDDIVYPTQIVGKRTRVRMDNSKLLKVYLDPKDVKEVEYKLQAFTAVYKKLTNKSVSFLFPSEEQ